MPKHSLSHFDQTRDSLPILSRLKNLLSQIVKTQALTFPYYLQPSTHFPFVRPQHSLIHIVQTQALTFPYCLQPITHYPIVQAQALTFPYCSDPSTHFSILFRTQSTLSHCPGPSTHFPILFRSKHSLSHSLVSALTCQLSRPRNSLSYIEDPSTHFPILSRLALISLAVQVHVLTQHSLFNCPGQSTHFPYCPEPSNHFPILFITKHSLPHIFQFLALNFPFNTVQEQHT